MPIYFLAQDSLDNATVLSRLEHGIVHGAHQLEQTYGLRKP